MEACSRVVYACIIAASASDTAWRAFHNNMEVRFAGGGVVGLPQVFHFTVAGLSYFLDFGQTGAKKIGVLPKIVVLFFRLGTIRGGIGVPFFLICSGHTGCLCLRRGAGGDFACFATQNTCRI